MVGRLRRSGRPDEGDYTRADIHQEIESCLALLAFELKRRIRVIRDFSTVPAIECRPAQLNQVFMNLLVNAVQAIEGEGEIRIRTWEDGGTVRIAIHDNGVGIPAELQSRIFEPGFTTKSAEKGTGLGLSICRRIVQQHGGCIRVESEAGKGTTFTMVLPIRRTDERKTND